MADGVASSSDAVAKPPDSAAAIRPRSNDVPDRSRPTIMSLPFHECVGIQTSTRRNALDGPAVSSARQNSGRSRNGGAALGVCCAGLRGSNVPVANLRVNATVARATPTPASAEHEGPYATGGVDCARQSTEKMDTTLSSRRKRAATSETRCILGDDTPIQSILRAITGFCAIARRAGSQMASMAAPVSSTVSRADQAAETRSLSRRQRRRRLNTL